MTVGVKGVCVFVAECNVNVIFSDQNRKEVIDVICLSPIPTNSPKD